MTDAKENKRVQALKVYKLLLRLFCIINRNASELIEKVSEAQHSENEKENTHCEGENISFPFSSSLSLWMVCIICLFSNDKAHIKIL